MSAIVGGADQAVRAFAFAASDALCWGAGWVAPGLPAGGAIGGTLGAWAGALELEGSGAEETWRLSGQGGDVELEAVSGPVWSDPSAPGQGFDQLCRVRGKAEVEGQGTVIDCLGWRGSRPAEFGSGIGSFRLAAAWFEADEGFAVLALRPGKARGQDEDAIEAVLFDPAGGRAVADPRLSTTYAESGQPARAGVELWMETEPDSEHLYPRRSSGHALAGAAQWRTADLTLEAQPFHWFSGDREGPGLYLLGHR